MAHTTDIVKYEKLSNGQFSVTIRCCGNASTDHVHTMAVTGDPAQRAANLATVREFVAQQHQAAMDAEAEAILLVGQTQEHQ